MYLAFKYTLFALVATAVNIGAQELSSTLYGGMFSLYLAMAFGTLAGLGVKYVLDKKYIFFHTSKGLADDSRMFVLYTLMGVVTTLVFWITEIGFDYFFQTRPMRYAGALLGLSLGYWIKYRLDKRFVFTEHT